MSFGIYCESALNYIVGSLKRPTVESTVDHTKFYIVRMELQLRRRSLSSEYGILASDVLLEAKNDSGTWSLATHKRITTLLDPRWAGNLAQAILDQLCQPDIGINERFKLAQLSTALRGRGYDRLQDVFDRYKDRLEKVKEIAKPDPLGGSVCKLIDSLYGTKGAPKMFITRPKGRMMPYHSAPPPPIRTGDPLL
jgi:hypothetical protein